MPLVLPINVHANDPTDSGSYTGPFVHGTDIYVISNTFAGDIVNVFKSSDSGATWTPIQLGVGPFSSAIPRNAYDILQDGTDIVAVWRDDMGGLLVRRFSMVSDTWGTASALGPDDGSGEDTTHAPLVRALFANTGDLYVFYTEWLTTNQTINYAVFNGTTWGSNTIIVSSSGTIFNYLGAIFQDSNNLIHLFYLKSATQAADAALYHVTLTTSGSIGTPEIIDPTLRSFPTGRAFEFNGTLNVIWYNSSARTGIWIGDSLTSPSWSFTLLNTIAFPAEVIDIGDQIHSAGSPNYGAKGFATVSGGVAHVIWQSSNGGPPFNFSVNAIYESSNSGSGWSAPILLFDEAAVDPPLLSPKLFALSAAVVNGELLVFSSIDCTGLYLVSNAPVEGSLSIICDSPPNGTVGVPYSHTFPVSGGTAPYTFAITAGALPNGLVLDISTGIVSGIPTLAGTFGFTITVTDADLNTASVSCSISIDTGVSLACLNPPSGILGSSYSHQIGITGGTGPFTITISVGALPTGLSISNTGLISGTPSAGGSFQFTIHLVDSIGNTADVTCTIIIVAPGNCPDGDIGGPG